MFPIKCFDPNCSSLMALDDINLLYKVVIPFLKASLKSYIIFFLFTFFSRIMRKWLDLHSLILLKIIKNDMVVVHLQIARNSLIKRVLFFCVHLVQSLFVQSVKRIISILNTPMKVLEFFSASLIIFVTINNLGSCEDYQATMRGDKETDKWIMEHTKMCPSCNTRIEKNAGCQHMTCRNCKHEFCWVCLEKWGGKCSFYNCANPQKQQQIQSPESVRPQNENTTRQNYGERGVNEEDDIQRAIERSLRFY